MNRSDKIQLLESIFDKAQLVNISKNPTELELVHGFRIETFIYKKDTMPNEFTFENIDDAISIISETRQATNMTLSGMKEKIIELCNSSNIDFNNKLGLRFLVS